MDPIYSPDVEQLFQSRDDEEVREELARRYLPLAEALAHRYRDSGHAIDDLIQVASIGMLKAIDRFDSSRGVKFESFAIPTILGELKRFHRDQGWSVRVPRRLQECALAIRDAVTELAQDFGRSPSVREVADHTHMSEDDVLEAMEVAGAYTSVSLDAPTNDESHAPAVADTVPVVETAYELAEEWAVFEPHLQVLDDRERRILVLRFFKDWTQNEIAAELGMSQMHVSRLLSRALHRLRESLARDGAMVDSGEELHRHQHAM
jgi:RNA polymerase sigma-B factor